MIIYLLMPGTVGCLTVSKANVIQQAAASEGRDALDTELQAAVGRLRALEAQREAIREQVCGRRCMSGV